MAEFHEQSRLDEDDAILADDVEARLSEYLLNPGNTLFSAGDRLASSYIGVPDIIRTLLNWSTSFTEDPNKILRQATEAALIEMEPRIIPQVNKALAGSDFSIPGIDAISDSKIWRPFFIAMAERQQTNVLSNALKRQQLLSSAHVNKASFSSPDAFMSEFHNLFSSLSLDSSEVNPSFLNRFAALTTYDECTSKAALYTLDRLSETAHNPVTKSVARRLAQHVRLESIKQICSIGRAPPTVAAIPAKSITDEESKIHMARQYMLTKCVAYDCPMRSDVVDSLKTVALSQADVGDFRSVKSLEDEISVVFNFYATLLVGKIRVGNYSIGDESKLSDSFRLNPITFNEKVVFIRVVCDELILQPLLEATFSVKRRQTADDALSPSKKRALCLLLAFVYSCHKMNDDDLLIDLRQPAKTQALCSKICTQYARIEGFVTTCETLKPGCPTYQIKEQMTTLVRASDDPFLSRGLLIWATEGLLGGSNLRDLRKTAITHLSFLAMIADKHPALRGGVVDAIKQGMLRDYGELEDMEIAEIKGAIMKCIFGLIRRGLGLALVKLFLDHLVGSQAIDIAHLRSFVVELLNIATVPYSPEFVENVTKLINTDRLQMALNSKHSRQSENQLATAVAKFKEKVSMVPVEIS